MWPRADTGQLDDTQSLKWTRHASALHLWLTADIAYLYNLLQ